MYRFFSVGGRVLLLGGIAVFSGAMVFSGGLSALGIVAFGTMLAGSVTMLCVNIYDEATSDSDEPAKVENNQTQGSTQTSNQPAAAGAGK